VRSSSGTHHRLGTPAPSVAVVDAVRSLELLELSFGGEPAPRPAWPRSSRPRAVNAHLGRYPSHVKVLGVTCSTGTALLSVVEDGEVVDATVQRVQVASLLEASAELESMLDEIGRALAQTKPDLVVLLLPEQSPRHKRTYQEIAPRAALETLVRLASVRAGIPIDVLPRATVRARLSLPRTGELSSHVSEKISAPVGKYWSAGRDVAALAALAGEAA
jgi:hypothetical protein